MDLTKLSASLLVDMMAKRQTSPSEVMIAHLDRIEQHNGAVNAMVAMRSRDELIAEARSLDDKPVCGPLHGLPRAIKDLLPTKDIRSTRGTPIHADYIPAEDAPAVSRIRKAGAVIMGKTNTPEWGHGSHSFNPSTASPAIPTILN